MPGHLTNEDFKTENQLKDLFIKDLESKLNVATDALFKITLNNPEAETWVNGPVNMNQQYAREALSTIRGFKPNKDNHILEEMILDKSDSEYLEYYNR